MAGPIGAEALGVRVTEEGGRALPCSPPVPSPQARDLAPGDRRSLVLDLAARCRLDAPGRYRVEVTEPGSRAAVEIDLQVTAME